MQSELRFYTFINMYLAGIHAGIQSAHVIHRTIRRYRDIPRKAEVVTPVMDAAFMLDQWMDEHETMIVCNAGYLSNLEKLTDVIGRFGSLRGFPWCAFYESQEALGGVQTGVGIVLPQEIFDVVDYKTANNSVTDAELFHLNYPFKDRAGSWFHLAANGSGDITVWRHYPVGTIEAELISAVKACPLAR